LKLKEFQMSSPSTAEAITQGLVSTSLFDRNGDAANIVDAVDSLARSCNKIALAILPDATPGHDATGATVYSLTEAAMGITMALVKIADSISQLAEAVELNRINEG
jgi:spore maturation protein SpmA